MKTWRCPFLEGFVEEMNKVKRAIGGRDEYAKALTSRGLTGFAAINEARLDPNPRRQRLSVSFGELMEAEQTADPLKFTATLADSNHRVYWVAITST